MIKHLFSCVAFFFLAVSPALAAKPHPLFAEDGLIKIRIVAPFKDLIRNAEKSTDPYPATLALLGDAPEEHAIALSARGLTRRNADVCKFPPLRVEFNDKPENASLFDGQHRLKLVTHCRSPKSYQQYYLLEYAAYKLLNAITPNSLFARLAEIDYVEAQTGEVVITRYGFFIEDTDDAAKRNGLKEIDAVGNVSIDRIDPNAAAIYALFQYMIGNLDWSMYGGPEGEDCCHNSKLIGDDDDPFNVLIPVPYDFDYSGLVDAPYAVPPDGINVSSVRTRRYRGFCRHNDQARLAAEEFIRQRDALFAVFDDIPGLEARTAKSAKSYLGDFFNNISDPEKLESRLLDNCRN